MAERFMPDPFLDGFPSVPRDVESQTDGETIDGPEAALEAYREGLARRKQLEAEAQAEIEGGFLGPAVLDPDHPEYMDPLGTH